MSGSARVGSEAGLGRPVSPRARKLPNNVLSLAYRTPPDQPLSASMYAERGLPGFQPDACVDLNNGPLSIHMSGLSASCASLCPPVEPWSEVPKLDRAGSGQSSSDQVFWPCPAAAAEQAYAYCRKPQQQSNDPSNAEVDALLEKGCQLIESPAAYADVGEIPGQDSPLDEFQKMLQAVLPVTEGQDACSPTARLITAPMGVHSRPVVPGDSSCQPGEALCSSCAGLKPQGDQLTERLAGSRTLADKQLASCLLLKSVGQCECHTQSSSRSSSVECARPGLYKHHDELASSSGQGWTVTIAQPRLGQEPRKKRGRGTHAWNVNWFVNSPMLLPQQDKILELLQLGFSSSSSSSSPAPCTLYSIRASDGPLVAYGVALAGEPPSSGRLGYGMWNPMRCSKEGHALCGKQLWLFKYAAVVYDREKPVAKRKAKPVAQHKEKPVAKRKKGKASHHGVATGGAKPSKAAGRACH